MSGGRWPVALTALAGAAAGAVVWRRHQRLHLTVLVKATFALDGGRAMSLVRPEPLTRPSPGRADDLAPFTRRPEVVVSGHARVPPAAPSATVRLSIYRDRTSLLDKQVDLARLVRPVQAGVFPLTPFGAVSRAAALDLSGDVVEVPSEFAIEALQWAPPDQWLGAPLVGDEWIALTGIDGGARPFSTRLPRVSAAARMHSYGSEPREWALDASLLHIDVDQQRCSVVFRGQTSIDGLPRAALHVEAGVATEKRPLSWGAPPSLAAPAQPRVAAPRSHDASLPFSGRHAAPPPAAESASEERGGTAALSLAELATINPRAAVPPAWAARAGGGRPGEGAKLAVDFGVTLPSATTSPLHDASKSRAAEPTAAQVGTVDLSALVETLGVVPARQAATPFSPAKRSAATPFSPAQASSAPAATPFAPQRSSSAPQATPFAPTRSANAPPSVSPAQVSGATVSAGQVTTADMSELVDAMGIQPATPFASSPPQAPPRRPTPPPAAAALPWDPGATVTSRPSPFVTPPRSGVPAPAVVAAPEPIAVSVQSLSEPAPPSHPSLDRTVLPFESDSSSRIQRPARLAAADEGAPDLALPFKRATPGAPMSATTLSPGAHFLAAMQALGLDGSQSG